MFEATGGKQKRKWQNLVHKKCPNCDNRLESKGLYFVCSNAHPTEPERACFFIKKEMAASFLLNPDHPANFCLSPHEREKVEEAVKEMGQGVSFQVGGAV